MTEPTPRDPVRDPEYQSMRRSFIDRWGNAALADADELVARVAAADESKAHPRLVQYGLVGYGSDPIETLHRHLTGNFAATLGAKDLTIQLLEEKLAAALAHPPSVAGEASE